MNADRWVLIVSMLFFFPVAAECQTAETYFIDDAGQPTAVVLESGRATVRASEGTEQGRSRVARPPLPRRGWAEAQTARFELGAIIRGSRRTGG